MRHIAAALLLALAACSKSEPPPPQQTSAQANEVQEVKREQDTHKEVESPPPAKLDGYGLTGPRRQGNLAIYLLHDPKAPKGDSDILVLEEAVKSGALKITEKGEGAEVNELQVENTGDKPVYLQAGDTVKGGQQDRTIAVDLILPPKSGKRSVDAFCVEPGRWHVREGQTSTLAASYSGASFALAAEPTPVASKEQKLAVRLGKSQEGVWAAGRSVNADLAKVDPVQRANASPSDSYVEAVENPAVAKKVNETVDALTKIIEGSPDAVGAAFCVNGKLQNLEVYSTPGLFRKLWPKLLRASAVEALSKAPAAESPAPPTEQELRTLLADFAGKAGKAELRPDGPVVRVFDRDKAVLFDTEHKGEVLHRQVLTK